MYNDVLIKADLLTEILKYNSTKEKKLKCELTDEHFAIEGEYMNIAK